MEEEERERRKLVQGCKVARSWNSTGWTALYPTEEIVSEGANDDQRVDGLTRYEESEEFRSKSSCLKQGSDLP